ncbi:MAG: DNA recombination protein RmuC [Chloroflexota bacterium]|nr:DNA recombination protein RmuC [Chloroflexota bacterium]
METLTTILLTVLILSVWGLIAAVVWLVLRSRDEGQPEHIAVLQAEMKALREQVGQNLGAMTQQVAVFGSVQEGIGKVTEATNKILELGQDITALQSILSAPKPRGGLGEIMLGNLLAQVLPGERYRLQHTFDDGVRVDAAIFLADHVVPIDSKFPLENFRRVLEAEDDKARKSARRAFVRDVKKRVDETAKYIRPDEGTFDFALMYVPAENVYYEILTAKDLFEHALEKHVIPVSPNSFFAYLNVIVFGLRGLDIEEKARLLLGQLSRLKKDFGDIHSAYSTLGTHISHAQGKYNELDIKLGRFGDKLTDVATGAALPAGGERPALTGE